MAEHLTNIGGEWIKEAHCRKANIDTNLFFPDRGSPTNIARQLCSPCEVKTECLNYALDNNLDTGIWGGTSGRQRRDLKRQRKVRLGWQPKVSSTSSLFLTAPKPRSGRDSQ